MSVTPDTVQFELQNILRCHTKPINHLAISPDYSRLISIGDDARAVVWSVASGEKLFVVERPFNGPATAASWASRDTSRFVIGFANGDLHLFYSESGKMYRDNVGIAGGGGAVEGIEYDATHDRIASICEKSTQLWRIKGTELIPILQSPLVSEGYGKCVQFCDNGASVVMYYLDTHECVCYSIEPWEKRWSKKLTSRIGHATLNHDGKLLLVSNLENGVDEYHFPSMEKVQTFCHPIETNCIIQSRSLPSWNLIVTGGDGGFARVFNRISGQLVTEIHHGARGELIQVVEAFIDSGDRCVVVTASSGNGPYDRNGSYDLKIWVYQPSKVPTPSKMPPTPATMSPCSTWRDRIAIAFIAAVFISIIFSILLTTMYLVTHPDSWYPWPDMWFHHFG